SGSLHAASRGKRLNIPASRRDRHSRQSCIISSVTSRRGKFITFEGLDGCGKSTQMEKLAAKLRERGLAMTVTREPGGTPAGEKIRQILLDTKTSRLSINAELALMFASRAHVIAEVAFQRVTAENIVVCGHCTDWS